MRIYNILEPRGSGILPREPQVTRIMSSPEVLQDHGSQLEDCGRVFLSLCETDCIFILHYSIKKLKLIDCYSRQSTLLMHKCIHPGSNWTLNLYLTPHF